MLEKGEVAACFGLETSMTLGNSLLILKTSIYGWLLQTKVAFRLLSDIIFVFLSDSGYSSQLFLRLREIEFLFGGDVRV